MFKQIQQEVQAKEDQIMKRGKEEVETMLLKLEEKQKEIIEKTKFYHELEKIYQEVMQLSNFDYLEEDNQRVFIVENCKWKKFKIDNHRLELQKMSIYQDIITMVQSYYNK